MAFPSCLWASLVFFKNSAFNLRPRVIACVTGTGVITIFFAFFANAGEQRQGRSKWGALPSAFPSLALLALLELAFPNLTKRLQATGVKGTVPILLVAKRARNGTLCARLGTALLLRVWNLEGLSRTKIPKIHTLFTDTPHLPLP